MEDRSILQALQTATIDAVAASTMADLTIRPVGITLDTNPDRWIECVFIPNNKNGFWGREKNYQGMYRMVLHCLNDTAGPYAAMDLLASVCSYFTKNQLIGSVQLLNDPDLTGPIENGAELLYVGSFQYTSFRKGA